MLFPNSNKQNNDTLVMFFKSKNSKTLFAGSVGAFEINTPFYFTPVIIQTLED